jgi:7-cyano-7-deazaguanine reductase
MVMESLPANPTRVGYHGCMPDFDQLECFDNPFPDRAYTIEHVSEEFTSVCPMTGHPDFGRVILRYGPAQRCVELKSLKLYYQSFRNEGAFYEKVTNVICDDLVKLMEPHWLVVITEWAGRGGIRSKIMAKHGDVPAGE